MNTPVTGESSPPDTFMPGEEPLVAPGVRAMVFDVPEGIYIPIIMAERPGSGDVARYLDSLPRDRRIVFPTVVSSQLREMLVRRGFEAADEWSEEMGEHVEIYHRLGGADMERKMVLG